MSSSKVARRKSENSLLERVKELRRAKDTGNERCFDCGDRGTTFVVLDFGIFTCETCAGAHQKYGHKAKNISMTKFTEEEVERMEGLKGNSAAASKWLARFATESDGFRPVPKDLTAIDKFVRNVFVDQKFKKLSSSAAAPAKEAKKKVSKKVVDDAVEEKVPSSMLSPPSKTSKPKKSAAKVAEPSSDSESVEAKPAIKKKSSVKPKKTTKAKSDSEDSESEDEPKKISKGKKKLVRKGSVEDIVDIGFAGSKASAPAPAAASKKLSKSAKAAAAIPDLVDFSEPAPQTHEVPAPVAASGYGARPALSRPVSYTAGAPGYFAPQAYSGPGFAAPAPAAFYGAPGYPSAPMGYPPSGYPGHPGLGRLPSYHPGMAPPQAAPVPFNCAVIPFDFVVRPAAIPEPVEAAPVVSEPKPVEIAPVAPMEDPFESLINQRNALEWNPMSAGFPAGTAPDVSAPALAPSASLSSPRPSTASLPVAPVVGPYGVPPTTTPATSFDFAVASNLAQQFGFGATAKVEDPVAMPTASPRVDVFGGPGFVAPTASGPAPPSVSIDPFSGVVNSEPLGHREGFEGLSKPLPASEGFQGFDAPLPASASAVPALDLFPSKVSEMSTPTYLKPPTKPSPAVFPTAGIDLPESGRASSRASKPAPAFFPTMEPSVPIADSRIESDLVSGFSQMAVNVEAPKRVHPTPGLFVQTTSTTPRKESAPAKDSGLGFAGFSAASERERADRERAERTVFVEGARASPAPAESVPKSLQDEEYNPFAVDAHYEEIRFDD